MSRKRQRWKVGDLFKVPLSDGSAVLGHVVAREPSMMNSVTCAFFDIKVPESCPPDEPPGPTNSGLVSCLFTTHDLLSSGTWTVIGDCNPAVPATCLPFENERANGWVGAKMHGSGIVRDFLDAYYGLAPWDNWG